MASTLQLSRSVKAGRSIDKYLTVESFKESEHQLTSQQQKQNGLFTSTLQLSRSVKAGRWIDKYLTVESLSKSRAVDWQSPYS